jgi:hypothetical protein
MAENTLGQTAAEFRAAVRRATERGPLGAASPAPAIDADAIAGAVEARVSEAVRREVAEQVAGPVDRAIRGALADQGPSTIDPQLIARLEAAAAQMPQGDSDVMLHLRNILPGQMRQEMHQQNQHVMQRLEALEAQLAAVQADNGLGRDLIRIALTGIVVAVVVVGVTVFQRQIQEWGRDTIYPMFGISIKEASSARPPVAAPAAVRRAQ